ncbi:hypothetical protein [Mesorhizobium sp. M0187]|uniref:hypothetical protein n=1 Tax=Mesorhizobium sp. M0187 TaxID=2956908 RepID=UPI003336F775
MRSSEKTKLAYTAAEFAEKHGLTVKAAEIILSVNGSSRVACDAAARAFKEAVAHREHSNDDGE